MKITCFARPPKFLNRMIMMLIGVFVQGIGLSFTDSNRSGDGSMDQLCTGCLKKSALYIRHLAACLRRRAFSVCHFFRSE